MEVPALIKRGFEKYSNNMYINEGKKYTFGVCINPLSVRVTFPLEEDGINIPNCKTIKDLDNLMQLFKTP